MKQRLASIATVRKRWLIAAIVAVACIVISGVFIADKDDTNTLPRPSSTVITRSTDNPDESKSRAKAYDWKGVPQDPKRIIIPKTNTDAYIQQVGVDQNKAVAVPSNIHLAGWFVDSVRPGQKGLSIIDGHVSGYTEDGIFKNLGTLVAGDTFSIQFGDNSRKEFSVLSTKTVATEDAANQLFS